MAEQNHKRITIWVETDPALFDYVITGDEDWFLKYDLENKEQ